MPLPYIAVLGSLLLYIFEAICLVFVCRKPDSGSLNLASRLPSMMGLIPSINHTFRKATELILLAPLELVQS
jgi:hypothetical protein